LLQGFRLPHNGEILTGKDLFGNFMPQPPSDLPSQRPYRFASATSRRKVAVCHGLIDEKRTQSFFSLRLWIDNNHDGFAEPSAEVRTSIRGNAIANVFDRRRKTSAGNQDTKGLCARSGKTALRLRTKAENRNEAAPTGIRPSDRRELAGFFEKLSTIPREER
jgi:hypothetical protein